MNQFNICIGIKFVQLANDCVAQSIKGFGEFFKHLKMERWRNDLPTIMPFFAWKFKSEWIIFPFEILLISIRIY